MPANNRVEMPAENEVAAALRQLALNERAKAYLLEHEPLYQALLRTARRFIGGETLGECRNVARQLNAHGHAVTIDFMGESTRDAAMAAAATKEFLEVIDVIVNQNLDSSVS